jgi:hypothetical protein
VLLVLIAMIAVAALVAAAVVATTRRPTPVLIPVRVRRARRVPPAR